MSDKELDQLREKIDALDARLLSLLSERGGLAQAVGRLKQARGDDATFYRPEREARVLAKIKDSNPGPFSDPEIARLFREVMSACLALEQVLEVAYLGPAGTYTQAAAVKHFGGSATTVSQGTIEAVFQEVEGERCRFGVVPVENSIEGFINRTLDLFTNSPLKICGEVELRIHHCLLTSAPSVGEIERVYAHEQSLAQCRHWLDANLPEAVRIAVGSNAQAAATAAEETQCAAIAGATAAEIYELEIVARNIEDDAHNTTRFLVIGRDEVPPSGTDKTSLVFATRNEPGSLKEALAVLADAGISLTRIESRPLRTGSWEYYFFVDIEGHVQQSNIAAALAELTKRVSMVKHLGSYPIAAF